MARYLGPADVFVYGDKEYTQGQNVPLSKELQQHHERFGHRFESTPEAAPIRPTTEGEPVLGAHPADAPIVAKTP